MKLGKKITAFILAFILAVNGLPVARNARAEMAQQEFTAHVFAEGEGNTAEEPRMKFVQTGFEDGVLTMSLQIKPEANAGNVVGGTFVFQTDLSTVIPITKTGALMMARDNVPVIISDSDHRELQAYKDYVDAEWLTDKFQDLMDVPLNAFDGSYTAYIVARAPAADGQPSTKMDCFFQFKYLDNTSTTSANKTAYYDPATGYVTVMNFKFFCQDSNGAPLDSASKLFASSITMLSEAEARAICNRFDYVKPAVDPGEEDKTEKLIMNPGAFVQRKVTTHWVSAEEIENIIEDKAFHYYWQPELTTWRGTELQYDYDMSTGVISSSYESIGREHWWNDGADVIPVAGTPTVQYDGVDNTYMLESFRTGIANTYGSNGDTDFKFPPNSREETPRYVIPTLDQMADDDWSWIPKAYLKEDGPAVPLKYSLALDIASASIASPVTEILNADKKDDKPFTKAEIAAALEKAMKKVSWDFWLDGQVKLSAVNTVEETGEGEVIETVGGKFLVKTAVINDPGVVAEDPEDEDVYEGTKVWNVYDADSGDFLMTSPEGVLMVMADTQVTYTDRFLNDGLRDTYTVKAPQFYVTSDAADPDNYIWHYAGSALIYSAKFDYRATYDEGGLNYQGSSIAVRLHREDSVPAHMGWDFTNMGQLSDEELPAITLPAAGSSGGSTVDPARPISGSFYVGTTDLHDVSTENVFDYVATRGGVPFQATLFDQYGMAITDRFSTVTIARKNSSAQSPFIVQQQKAEGGKEDTNNYNILYGDDVTVNDVTPGVYTLTGTYFEKGMDKPMSEKADIYIGKPKDRLNTFQTRFTVDSSSVSVGDPVKLSDEGQQITVRCRVPLQGEPAVNAAIELTQFSNQWWLSGGNPGDYDVIKGIRKKIVEGDGDDRVETDSVTVDWTKLDEYLTEHVDSEGNPRGSVKFEVRSEVPYGVTAGSDFTTKGKLSYSHRVSETREAELKCRVTLTIDGVTRYVDYVFQFYREARYLRDINITPNPAGASENKILITVPSSKESTLQFKLENYILPQDQYGSDWGWGEVTATYGSGTYAPWTVVVTGDLPDQAPDRYIYQSSTELDGDTHASSIYVEPNAPNTTFTIHAEYANVVSNEMTVEIRRKASVASSLDGPRYGEISVPDNTATQPLRVEPEFTVADQYSAPMAADKYVAVWTCTPSIPEAADYISIDRSTGVLTVQPCAPKCTVTVTVSISGTSLSSTNRNVEIDRESDRITEMRVSPTTIDYPTLDSGSSLFYMEAECLNQYAQSEEDWSPVKTSQITMWRLDEVVLYDDGGTYAFAGSEGQPAGTQPINFNSGTYTINNWLSFTSTGTLSFNTVSYRNQIPEYITVTVVNNQGGQKTQQIHVILEESKPTAIYFPVETYQNGIKAPVASADPSDPPTTKTLNLSALVWDQYSLFIDNCPVTWIDPDADSHPTGISVDTTAKTVTVTSDADSASVHLKARVEVEGEDPIERDIQIAVVKGDLKIRRFDIKGVNDSLDVYLPASKGGSGSAVYSVQGEAIDIQNHAYSSASVTWSVTGTTGGIQAAFTDPANGKLKVTYTDTAFKNMTKATPVVPTISVKVVTNATGTVGGVPQYENTEEGKQVFSTATLSVVFAPQKPTYAVPTMVYDPSQDIAVNPNGIFLTQDIKDEHDNVIGQVHKPIIQKVDSNVKTVVKVTAVVMDQYGREMDGSAPASERAASIEIPKGLAGVELKALSKVGVSGGTENAAELTIGSDMVGSLIAVTAYPEGITSALADSRLTIETSKGIPYPEKLSLNKNNTYQVEIPKWIVNEDDESGDSLTILPLDMGAQILDQYGAPMETITDVYPVWTFVGDHTGVEFDGVDPDSYEGTLPVLNISNLAVSSSDPENKETGKLEKQITLEIRTEGGVDKTDPDYETFFVKTVTLTLTRDPLPAGEDPVKYLYIEDVDSSGVAKQELGRPRINADGSAATATYVINPALYDAYGDKIETVNELKKITVDLDVEDLERRGFLVEALNQRGALAGEKDPIAKYNIYYVKYAPVSVMTFALPGEEEETEPAEPEVKILLATFDRTSGALTITSQCDTTLETDEDGKFDHVLLTATYTQGEEVVLTRSVQVNITQETARFAARASIGEKELVVYVDGPAKAPRDGDEDEEESDEEAYRFALEIFDQYGEPFDVNKVIISKWQLADPESEKDADGVYSQVYTELDEDGLEIQEETERLLRLNTTRAAKANYLFIRPSNYSEPTEAVLQCLLVTTEGNTLVGNCVVRVTTKHTGGHSSGSGYTVTFEAGEYGKLVGPAEYTLEFGDTVTPPGVKTILGYGFLGWTLDGETLVDASVIPVFGDITYIAVYRDVTQGAFLEGYKDKTVRPDALITRAEFVTMAVKAVGGFNARMDYGKAFPDVETGKWYSNAIAYAKQMGIINGYPDGTFRPNNKITRAEAARILADLAGLESENTGNFSDVKEGRWYTKYIEALHDAGVVAGYPDGTYKPGKHLTRAEAVRMVLTLTWNAPSKLERDNIRDYAYCPFTDIKRGHWAYAYILRAAGIA